MQIEYEIMYAGDFAIAGHRIDLLPSEADSSLCFRSFNLSIEGISKVYFSPNRSLMMSLGHYVKNNTP